MTKFATFDFVQKKLRAMRIFSTKIYFFLLLWFLIIGWGKGGRARGALNNIAINVYARDKNNVRAAFDLVNTVRLAEAQRRNGARSRHW